ncbi:Imm7 family immunity protein [Sphingobacterium faecium]|uniref:Imm7 family immunity protein n=1 Tax=Sphingobacterium faecium TaxID=34087 RepID=UPI003D360934
MELKELNGRKYLLIGINHNHNNGMIELVEQLLKNIGLLSKGCYGIVYVRDDESLENVNFRVIKLARGRVATAEDSLLSPCNPTIED